VDSLQADSVWIGWGISRSRDEVGRMITSSTPGDDRPGGLPFSAAVGDAGVASGAPIAILFGFSASSRSSGASYDAVDVMLTRSAGAPTNLGGRRVAWLGEAPHEESLNLLRALHQQIPNETVRAEIVATYALHQQPQDDDIAVLERLAFEDPSPRLRQEAASALSDIRRPAAGRALIRIAKRASDPIVRAEAVQQLDEFETEEVIAALVSIAFEEAVREVSLEAVHTLSDFRTPSARAGLRRLAVEHTDAAVRAEALQELTDR
jgi:hypothetical protein